MSLTIEDGREAVAVLEQLAHDELDEDREHLARARVEAVSRALLGPASAEQLEYARYEVDWLGVGTKTVQGLALVDAELLLTEIIDQLRALDDSELGPLASRLGLDVGQLRAGLYATYWILNSLEWESRDRDIEAEYAPEVRERMLASRLRSLASFRATGEP